MFKTPEELQEKVDAYFDETPLNEQTITGLALDLGFVDRQSIYDYEKRPEYSCIIKKARSKVEYSYEVHLKKNDKPTGAIFALKNMGWRDERKITTEDVTPIDKRIIEARKRRSNFSEIDDQSEDEEDE
ncbi:MAG: terminase small subunit [Pseudomonadota bacterium]